MATGTIHFLTVTSLVGLVLLSAEARGQTAPSQPVGFESEEETLARARSLFEAGVALTQQNRWAEAASLFTQSRAARDRPRTAFNLALCLQHMGRLVEADQVVTAALAMQVDAELSRDLATLQAAVRGAFATLTLTLEPTVAQVLVDGSLRTETGPSRTLSLDPGRHLLEVRADGWAPQHFELTLQTAERVARRVALSNTVGVITVRPTPAEAAVSVDDLVIGRGLTHWTGVPGGHRVRVEANGYRPLRQSVMLAGGQSVEVVAALTREERGLARNPVFWTLLGVGVVAAIVIPLATIVRVGEPDTGTLNYIFRSP